MRLIDADKLKVYLQEYLGYGHAIPWVDEQPTAYDVDKVVTELEKRSNEVISNIFAYEEDDHIGIYNDGLADGYEYSIGIVRKGGVE